MLYTILKELRSSLPEVGPSAKRDGGGYKDVTHQVCLHHFFSYILTGKVSELSELDV